MASHVVNRKTGNTRSFGAGIFVCAPGTHNVYCEPVRSISLLATHRSAIMSHTCREVNKWPSLFNGRENFSSGEDAAATCKAVTRAKLLQNPAKRSSGIINLTGAIDILNLDSPSAGFSASDDAGLGYTRTYGMLVRQK